MADVEAIFTKYSNQIEAFKEEFANEFLERVKARTPVKTGLLQRSWESEIDEDAIVISNDVPYAQYIEYGTPKIAPFAMLEQTVAEVDEIAGIALSRVQQQNS